MPKQGSSFTNHPAVIDFNGSSYFFYHNGALPGGGGFTRSVAVERFTFNSNGTFPTITMTTAGAPQVGTLNPYVTNEAEATAWASGVETEAASEGGRNVAFIDNGDYIKVKGVDFGSGAASFEARVASATNGGNIEIRRDSPTGTLMGTCTVAGTGGWQTWMTRSCGVSGATGIHDLYLRFTGGSGSLFNVNWWRFNAASGGPTPTPTATPVPSGEVLANGNAEAGTTGWAVFGSGSLSSNTSVVHGGTRSLSITGRTASWNGPSQNVTSRLTNGKSYTTSVWVRTQSGTPSAKVTLQLTANGSTSFITLAPARAVNSSDWTQLSGTATVSWSGTLSSATFYVETSSGTDSFFIDDASFQ
jgi:hypothetical protein